MKTPEQDRLARWLIMTGKQWHWFPTSDRFEPITPTAIEEEGPYPVKVDMGPGPSGADSVDGFLRDGWLNGSWAMEVLLTRDAEHAASSSVAWEALERVSDMLQGAENPYDFNSGHWHLWNDRRKRELSAARAALALRPGGKP